MYRFFIIVHLMQVECHKLVVDRYTTKCNRAYACLENDSYVYQKLPYHMAASGIYVRTSFLAVNLAMQCT
jgi:hypothetical protein